MSFKDWNWYEKYYLSHHVAFIVFYITTIIAAAHEYIRHPERLMLNFAIVFGTLFGLWLSYISWKIVRKLKNLEPKWPSQKDSHIAILLCIDMVAITLAVLPIGRESLTSVGFKFAGVLFLSVFSLPMFLHLFLRILISSPKYLLRYWKFLMHGEKFLMHGENKVTENVEIGENVPMHGQENHHNFVHRTHINSLREFLQKHRITHLEKCLIDWGITSEKDFELLTEDELSGLPIIDQRKLKKLCKKQEQEELILESELIHPEKIADQLYDNQKQQQQQISEGGTNDDSSVPDIIISAHNHEDSLDYFSEGKEDTENFETVV